jgi:hypothetical protein
VKRRILKWIAVFILGVVLLIALSLLYLRETLGGAYLTRYVSPINPDYVVEMHAYEPLIGTPAFSLFVVESGQRNFVCDFSWQGDNEKWSPWTERISWTADGKVVFCMDDEDDSCRAAYVFGDHQIWMREGLPKTEGLKPTRIVDQASLTSFLHEHGGEGVSFPVYAENSGVFIWHDFIPWKNN